MTVHQRFRVDPTEFAGRRVVVTGGTKGAGAAVAARFAAAGAKTLAAARSAPQELEEGRLFVAADLTTEEGIGTLADAVLSGLGGVDILVQ